MACVVCGKKQRILSIQSIKYPSENSVPEVLSIVIGNKIAEENWNDGEKQICLSCNRKCKEFDDLNIRLEDLKLHLLKEYTKKKYRETRGEEREKEKKITSKNVDKDKSVEVDSGEKETGDEGSGDTEREERVENVEGEKENEGRENESQETEENEKDKGDDNEKQEENINANKPVRATITMTIKNEADDSSADEAEDADWSGSERLPEALHKGEDDKVRMVSRHKLQRLPDYEYQQWYTLDAYSYVLQTENNRGQLLKCSRSGCPVSCRVTKMSALVKVNGEHRHEPETAVADRNNLYQKLKERCMEDQSTPLLQIYEEEAQRFASGASLLPFPEVRMREWRATNDPTIVIHTNASPIEESTKKYHCEVCNMGFNSSRLLQRHADRHNMSKTKRKKLSGEEAYVAKADPGEEGKRLRKTLEKKLKRVVKKIKTEEEAISEENSKECHICQEKFSRLAQVKKHILESHKEVLMCEHCDVAFDTLLLLKRHKISCRKCCDERLGQKQKSKEEIDMEKELSRITGQDVGENPDQDPDDPDWEATKADESTADETEEAVPAKKKKTEEVMTVHSCQVCDALFPDRVALKNHLYTHSSVNKYECGTCAMSYNKKAVLTRHMISENHKEPMKLNEPCIDSKGSGALQHRAEFRGAKFECAVCSASFPRQAALLHHMRRQKHITDQIIIHEWQSKPTPVRKSASRISRYYRDAIKENVQMEHMGTMEGARFAGEREARQMNGKKPLECAVCGDGFQSRVKLLAHMEATGHLTDSIVENIPVLESDGERNQIVPGEFEDIVIKQEPRDPKLEILSQVVLPTIEHKQELPDENEQAYFIQTGENGEGETVMVIHGDIEGSLTENMQLYMDEEGNIVTHDEEGNPVRVMQVDLSALRHGESDAQGVDAQHNEQFYETRQMPQISDDSAEMITPDHPETNRDQENNQAENLNESSLNQDNGDKTAQIPENMPVQSTRLNMPQINIEIDENIERDEFEDAAQNVAQDNEKESSENPSKDVEENASETPKANNDSIEANASEDKVDERTELEAPDGETKTNEPETNEPDEIETETKANEEKREMSEEAQGEDRRGDKRQKGQRTPRRSESERSKASVTPRATRHSTKTESLRAEQEKMSTRSRNARK